MRLGITSVLVDDQDKALDFYTRVLGFVVRDDLPMGEFRWITVVSPEDPGGMMLSIEPDIKPYAKAYKEGAMADGIPLLVVGTDDIQAEYERLVGLGVRFVSPPAPGGPILMAVFDDTCGNLVLLSQPLG